MAKSRSSSKQTVKNTSASSRSIDRVRDSAGSMKINPPDDDSPITDFLKVNGQLHVVKARGVYRVMLADEIDPDRKNPHIPNTVQRVLRMGSDSELVGRTLFTANNLFNRHYLPKEVDCDRGLSLALAITRCLVSMSVAADSLREEEVKAAASIEATVREDRSLIIPDVGVVEAECKAFLQQAGHVERDLLEIVKLFYRNESFKKWFDGVANKLSETLDPNDEFLKFVNAALPLLRLVRGARNGVEHPKADECVKVTDFFINSNGELVTPTIEVIHPESPLVPTSASEFNVATASKIGLQYDIASAIAIHEGRHETETPIAIRSL